MKKILLIIGLIISFNSNAATNRTLDTITVIPNYRVEIPIFENVTSYIFFDNYIHIKTLIDNIITDHYVSKDLILRIEVKPNEIK